MYSDASCVQKPHGSNAIVERCDARDFTPRASATPSGDLKLLFAREL